MSEKVPNNSKKKKSWVRNPFITVPSIAVLIAALLTVFGPEILRWLKSNTQPEIVFEAKGNSISELVERIRMETDYSISCTSSADKFRVEGIFDGHNWVDILRKVAQKYSKELDCIVDDKNKKISIRTKGE